MTGTYFEAADHPETTTIEPATYLSIAGDGPPGTDAFYAKKNAIASVAEQLDLAGPVEIIYWFGPEHGEVGIADFYWSVPLEHVRYRILIRVPDDTELPPPTDRPYELSLFTMAEGDVVQVMHHGPFGNEQTTLARLGNFARRNGLRRSGPHHEIHLDPFDRDTPQEGLRTILRDPVSPTPRTVVREVALETAVDDDRNVAAAAVIGARPNSSAGD